MLVVRVTENVRAVQYSYYSNCPCLGLVTLNPQHQPPGPSPIGLVIQNAQLVGRRPHLNELLMGCGRCLLIFSTCLA
jgi:hypothetical protein